jgi:peptide/nickel transport system ATP-binding protein
LIDDLSVEYSGGSLALDEVSFSVGPREILGVVGESGCGKSTLGLTILRLLPANGQITGGVIQLVDRGDLSALPNEEMRRVRGAEIAMIFQDASTSLNPRVSVGAQMMQVQRAHSRDSRSRGEQRDWAMEKLTEVGLPNAKRAFDRYPHEFSGGMRQRAMIAMALLQEPKLIIADEATSALDVTLEAQILELLLRLREQHGTAILFISHDLGIVSQFCDRVAVMYAGRVVEQIPGHAVLSAPRHPYTQALNAAVPTRSTRGQRLANIGGHVPDTSRPIPACAFAPRCLHTADVCRQAVPDLYDVPDGMARCFAYGPDEEKFWAEKPTTSAWRARSNTSAAPIRPFEQPPTTSDRLIEVADLSVHFATTRRWYGRPHPPVRAVDGVSLTLQRGRVLGLVGESGSGKTTLGEALVKLNNATGGSVIFGGQDLSRLSQRETFAFRRRAQMVFQNPYSSLSPRIRVGRLVTEPYDIHRIPQTARRGVDELLAQVDLSASLSNAYPGQLSGGQARRVGIARALALEPELVVADEPTSGLDASAAASTMNLLVDLRDRMGLTVVLITHSLSLVVATTDELCVMYFGQVVEQGETAAVTAAPAHPYTKALLELAPDSEAEPRRGRRRRLLVPGEIPSPDSIPTGCRFHPRCMYARDICREQAPPLVDVTSEHDGLQWAARCHFADEVRRGVLAPSRDATDGDAGTLPFEAPSEPVPTPQPSKPV